MEWVLAQVPMAGSCGLFYLSSVAREIKGRNSQPSGREPVRTTFSPQYVILFTNWNRPILLISFSSQLSSVVRAPTTEPSSQFESRPPCTFLIRFWLILDFSRLILNSSISQKSGLRELPVRAFAADFCWSLVEGTVFPTPIQVLRRFGQKILF